MIDHQLNQGKGVVQMGGAINRCFISAHLLLSAYFLTAQTYKCMRLTTRVYGIYIYGMILNHLPRPASIWFKMLPLYFIKFMYNKGGF